jgi:hypothetical protein
MIVVDLENNVLGSAPQIERVDVGNEIGLIKVNLYPEQEYGFFYIGTLDRDLYSIIGDETLLVPYNNKSWFYIDGEFIEKPSEPTQSLYDLI